MADDAVGEGARYWAFISYSHKDAAFGRRLHRRLEGYRLPRRLVGRATAQGTVPRRLVPIFRDRDELPAANDLSAEVRTALQASRSLIVVCSRAAAASPWVGREVETFRKLHPGRPVLAVIREGEPAECFPEALRRGSAGEELIEPLAADFRPGQDGAHLGLLKLVGGIVGIGLDELVQRDAQRNLRRVTAITTTALTAMLIMGLLTIFAVNARQEAERQRAGAEGLVEFMLTDLRTKLKGVGRLDVMTAVNRHALDYYDADLNTLPPKSLGQRARVLHALGEDDTNRGELAKARAHIEEARRTTAALLAADPQNPGRIFDQAQSEYWMGYVDYLDNRLPQAKRQFERYKDLTSKLIAIDARNPRYQREAAYADGNLCAIALEKPPDPLAAIRYCGTALAEMEKAAHGLGPSPDISNDLINRHSWLADAYRANGEYAKAKAERLVEEAILARMIAADPKNLDIRDTWVALQRALAKLELQDGKTAEAVARLERALVALDGMLAFDPANNEWLKQRTRIGNELLKSKAIISNEPTISKKEIFHGQK